MTAPAAKILYAAPFRRLETLLPGALDRLSAGDPLRERRVLVTSNRLRDHLQALLAKERARVGISFLTLRDLAAKLGEPLFQEEGFRRLPPLGGAAAGEKALLEEEKGLGPLAGAARIPGYGAALYATWTDVLEADLGPEDVSKLSAGLAGDDRRWLADLSRLLGALGRHLAAHRFYDDPLLFRRACLAAEAEPPDVPTLIYGFADMNALQRRLVAACCRAAPAAAFVPAEEEAPASAFAGPQRAWFSGQGFSRADAPAGPRGPFDEVARALFGPGQEAELPDGALTVISAPSESRESFELIREIFTEGEDGAPPPGTVGVLIPAAGVYPGLFRETFSSLGIPVSAAHPVPLSEAPEGRVFLRLLSMDEENCAREEVTRFLDEGRFVESPSFEGESPDLLLASSWEYLSRSLEYASRRGDWESAIRRARQRSGKKSGGETLRLLDGFAGALERLFGAWEKRAAHGPLSAHISAALDAFENLTGPLAGKENLTRCMARLGEIAPILGEVPFSRFRDWARRALAEFPVPPEKTLSRISLLSLQEARGLPFDTVVIPALSEGVFPAGGREDPLLPDRLRERMGRALQKEGGPPRIPLKGNRVEEDRFLFAAALAAARRRAVLGFSRGGAAGARERAPSLFLHALSEAAGRSPGEEDFLPRLGGYRAASAVLEGEMIATRAVSLREYDLAHLAAQLPPRRPEKGVLGYLLSAKPGFGRRRASLSDRWRMGALTGQDGIFAAPEILPAIRAALDLSRRAVAITRLEEFFECPYRFALKNILGLSDRRAEGRKLEFDGAEKGQIVHAVLQKFFHRLSRTPETVGEQSAEELKETLEGALREGFEGRERAGDALPPLMESVLRERCRRLLEDYFDQGFHSAYRPIQAEGGFGRKQGDALEVAAGGGGETIGLSGRFDLLESNGEGSYRFVDFKTGRPPRQSAALAGGTLLQVPLYSRYGEKKFGPEAEIRGAYIYLDENGKARLRESDPEKMKETAPLVDELLSFFHASCREGRFFPVPSDACRNCAYISVCGPERKQRAGRKAEDPLWREWKALKEKAE